MSSTEFDGTESVVDLDDDNDDDSLPVPGLVDTARIFGKIFVAFAAFCALSTIFAISVASDSRLLMLICGPALWALVLGGESPIGILLFVGLTFILFGLYAYLIASRKFNGLLMLLVIHGFTSLAFYIGIEP